MTDSPYEQFKKLWKVKILFNLREITEKDETVTRTTVSSIERDLSMIRYGFEAGLKKGSSEPAESSDKEVLKK